jgi:hypothetical protein
MFTDDQKIKIFLKAKQATAILAVNGNHHGFV